MVSYKTSVFIQVFLLVIYGIQIFTDILFITSNIININNYVKTYTIINFIFNILFLIYLFIRLNNFVNDNYDTEYFEFYDYWFFASAVTMYFLFIVFLYTSSFNKDDKKELMKDTNFRVYLFTQLPIAFIFVTITGLFLLFGLLMIICCFQLHTNKIEPDD